MGVLKNEFTWSKSRDGLFQECRRAYYLNHYGAWDGWRLEAPPETRELYFMKHLSTRATWLGIVVHEVAERAVRAIQRNRYWPLEAALSEAEQRLRADLEHSREGRYREGVAYAWGGRRVKATGLQEHYYGMEVLEEEWEVTISQALQCIRNLYASPPFRRLLEIPPDHLISIEELRSFLVDDVKVWVKLDLAVRGRDGGIVIVDWKTGGAHRVEDVALQLGIYGLYGSRLWDVAPENIRGYDVNLKDGSTRQHHIDAQVLTGVIGYIQESARQMREPLDDAGENSAHIDRFPQTEDQHRCQRCRFRRACDRE